MCNFWCDMSDVAALGVGRTPAQAGRQALWWREAVEGRRQRRRRPAALSLCSGCGACSPGRSGCGSRANSPPSSLLSSPSATLGELITHHTRAFRGCHRSPGSWCTPIETRGQACRPLGRCSAAHSHRSTSRRGLPRSSRLQQSQAFISAIDRGGALALPHALLSPLVCGARGAPGSHARRARRLKNGGVASRRAHWRRSVKSPRRRRRSRQPRAALAPRPITVLPPSRFCRHLHVAPATSSPWRHLQPASSGSSVARWGGSQRRRSCRRGSASSGGAAPLRCGQSQIPTSCCSWPLAPRAACRWWQQTWRRRFRVACPSRW